MLKQQRNDPCPCGSGKKYKRCHLKIDEAYLFSYKVTFDPLEDEFTKNYMEPDDRKRLLEIGEEIIHHKFKKSFIKELLLLKEKYPKVPRIYNFLANIYSHFGDSENTKKVIDEGCKLIPDYFFNKVTLANRFIDQGEKEKVLELFPELNLKKTYPNRNLFHVSEVVSFLGILGRFYLREFNIDAAIKCLKKATDLDYYQPVLELLDAEIQTYEEAALEAVKESMDLLFEGKEKLPPELLTT